MTRSIYRFNEKLLSETRGQEQPVRQNFGSLKPEGLFSGRQGIEKQPVLYLKFGWFWTIIFVTHPPRLSGFDRDAQPWWVFYACLAVSHYAI